MSSGKCKRKLKKRILFIVMAFIILFCLYLSLYFFINVKLIGNRDIYLNYGTKYFENGYSAELMGINIKNVNVKNNINEKKLGEYEVVYTVKFLGLKKQEVRKIHVVDKEKPVIELTGDKVIYLNLYAKYNELGFKAIDNVDGDITDRVKVDGTVDSNKTGSYKLTYSVVDSSNNEISVTRQVDVTAGSLLTASVNNFRLTGYFEDVTLKYEEKEYDYFKDTVFIGDSNTTFLYSFGRHIGANQTWGRNNLNIAQINSSTFTVFSENKNYTLKAAFDKFKPKYIIVCPGINAALYMNKDVYINELNKFIDFMNNNYKDIKYSFVSIFPITTGTLSLSYQANINKFNYYLAEVCHNRGVNFINFADEVKAANGYADGNYFECKSDLNCGFHLNTTGKNKYIDYIKHLNLGGM